ncbi:Vitamin B12 transporter BtuB [Saliniradius amylolyticus]|uniref:Vitamin B12 transporter BtuB n=1 Tax=Saliniradius amylolyticus TaxID=2183582 RepID=A0A2S2E705_9ALTE|nr:TonB-dependent receptor [Saliniradius amylolyticus]AWL13389.1 Vitamin B12 transporter BtuB [Saliniradius amylolyticus]
MPTPNTRFSAALLCAVLSSSSLADNIETISVTGSRLPINQQQLASALTVIDQDTIERSQALSVLDLLRTQAGINISQSGGRGAVAEIRLRGSESNHTLVLVDGVEINDLGSGGLVDFSHLQLANIARIEILRGPQSALWGSGAIGGVINIITQQARDPRASLSAKLADHSSHNLSAAISNTSGPVSYGVNVNRLDVRGHNIARQGDENDNYDNQLFGGQLNWQLSEQSILKASYRHTDASAEFDAPNYMTTGLPEDADRVTDTTQQQAKLEWHFTPSDASWQHQLGYRFSRNENITFANNDYRNDNDSSKQRLFWQSSVHYDTNSRLTLAVEAIKERFQQAGVNADVNQTRDNTRYALVGDWLHQVTAALSASVSLRYDDNDFFEDSHSYRAGLSYQLTGGHKLYASAGQAVKNPTFTELFGYFPDFFIGNPDLEAEKSQTLEVGGQFALPKQWQLDLSIYDATLDDEITPSADFTSSINASGESERRGGELKLAGQWQKLGLTLDYAYIDARQPNFRGQLQPEQRRARHTGGLTLDYQPSDKISVFISGSYQGTRLDTNFLSFQRVRLPAYSLLSVGGEYRLTDKLALTLRADNALDEDYEDVLGYRGQRRRLWLGLDYSL